MHRVAERGSADAMSIISDATCSDAGASITPISDFILGSRVPIASAFLFRTPSLLNVRRIIPASKSALGNRLHRDRCAQQGSSAAPR